MCNWFSPFHDFNYNNRQPSTTQITTCIFTSSITSQPLWLWWQLNFIFYVVYTATTNCSFIQTLFISPALPFPSENHWNSFVLHLQLYNQLDKKWRTFFIIDSNHLCVHMQHQLGATYFLILNSNQQNPFPSRHQQTPILHLSSNTSATTYICITPSLKSLAIRSPPHHNIIVSHQFHYHQNLFFHFSTPLSRPFLANCSTLQLQPQIQSWIFQIWIEPLLLYASSKNCFWLLSSIFESVQLATNQNSILLGN